MSSPWLALKRTSTDVLTVVSASSGAIATGAATIEQLASVGLAHATNYRVSVEIALKQDLEQNIERRKQALAISDATFYLDIKSQLSGNPELAELYETSLAKYNAA
jgi:hypothetical protein